MLALVNRKPLFLDRDGVLNRDMSPYIPDAESLEIFPWTAEALESLDRAGYDLFVVSNQQAVGRGYIPEEELQKQTEKIDRALAERGVKIRHYYYCRALSEENHPWRKPGCGMIEAARDEYGVDPRGAFLIGDRWSDVEAAHRAGCRPLLVLSGGTSAGWEDWEFLPEKVFVDLLEAAKWIVAQG